ncbi:MAG: hypothetical protein ABSC54_09490 [Smithellaceae bacterium]|jgi:hypothetical protein
MDNMLDGKTTKADEKVASATTEKQEVITDGETPVIKPTETQITDKGSEPEKEAKIVREVKGLRRRSQEAEQQAAYYKGLAEGRGVKPEPTAVVSGEPTAPKIEDFETIEEYDKAREVYLDKKVDFKVSKELERAERSKIEARQKEDLAIIEKTFEEKMSEAMDVEPELETMKNTVGVMIRRDAPDIALAIKQSDIAPDLIRYLYNNKEELQRINNLTNPIQRVRELVNIEAKLKAPSQIQTKKVTQAPAPIETVNPGGTGIVTVDPEKQSTADWIKAERERKRAERK